MRILNAQFKHVADARTGMHAAPDLVRGCATPYGRFRSVSVARDVLLTQHPEMWIDLVGKVRDRDHLAKRVYSRIYTRCKSGRCGWSLEKMRWEQ